MSAHCEPCDTCSLPTELSGTDSYFASLGGMGTSAWPASPPTSCVLCVWWLSFLLPFFFLRYCCILEPPRLCLFCWTVDLRKAILFMWRMVGEVDLSMIGDCASLEPWLSAPPLERRGYRGFRPWLVLR